MAAKAATVIFLILLFVLFGVDCSCESDNIL